jgi:hypothetical protein
MVGVGHGWVYSNAKTPYGLSIKKKKKKNTYGRAKLHSQ